MTGPIRILIVEDQSLIAEGLRTLVEKYGISVSGMCRSADEAIQSVKQNVPDLILMDIHLDGAIDGISAATIINEERSIPVIYLTDMSDEKTVQRAKQTFPVSYMTKPYNEADLVRAIDFACYAVNHSDVPKRSGSNVRFLRTDTQNYVRLDTNDILYLEASRSYCNIITASGSTVLATSLNHVHEQLADPDFMRVHRSFVVNFRKITEVNGNVLKLGTHEVQMSKEYREKVLSRMDVIR